MGDSDDEEIFWGPVSARELIIIRKKMFPKEDFEYTEDLIDASSGSNSNKIGELSSTHLVENNQIIGEVNDNEENTIETLQVSDCALPNLSHTNNTQIISSCDTNLKNNKGTNSELSSSLECETEDVIFNETWVQENKSNVSQVKDSELFNTSDSSERSHGTRYLLKDGESDEHMYNSKEDTKFDDLKETSSQIEACKMFVGEAVNKKDTRSSHCETNDVISDERYPSVMQQYNVSGSGDSTMLSVKNKSDTKCTSEFCDKSECTNLSNIQLLSDVCSASAQFSISSESGILSNGFNSIHSKFSSLNLDFSESPSFSASKYSTQDKIELADSNEPANVHSDIDAYNCIDTEEALEIVSKKRDSATLRSISKGNPEIRSSSALNSPQNTIDSEPYSMTSDSNVYSRCYFTEKNKISKIPVPQNSHFIGSNPPNTASSTSRHFSNFESPTTDPEFSNRLTSIACSGYAPPKIPCSPIVNSLGSISTNNFSTQNGSEFSEKDFEKKSLTLKDDYAKYFTESRIYNLDAEHGSVLLRDSSDESDLNNTLEEVEMIMKAALKSGSSNSNIIQSPVSKTIQCGQTKPCRYIGEKRPSPLQKELKNYLNEGYTPKTAGPKPFAMKPDSNSCRRPLRRVKKIADFSDIKSPIAAYIKNRPVQLIKTAGKIKYCGKDDIPLQSNQRENVRIAKQISGAALPEIMYEKAPGINVKQTTSGERYDTFNKPPPTATVIRHAGRAVLTTVPQNALHIMKNAEVSVLYDVNKREDL